MSEKLIKIYVGDGRVEKVTGVPKGYLYKIIDRDNH